MDTPVRKYQKQKDYQRHKLFRKMKRRRRAAIEQAKDAPMKQLRRKLKIPKFEGGKDKNKELPYPLRSSKDYDDNLAYQSGIIRDPKTGHMWSTTQEEYPDERTYLKKPNHPTFNKALWGDLISGYDVYFKNGNTYSAPTFSELMYIKPPFKFKMPKFEGGKDDKPNVFQLADGTFVNSHNEPLEVLDYAGVEDPTKWTYVDKKGNRYTPKATRTLTEGERFTQRQIENEQNTRPFEFTPYIEGANEGAAMASLMMGFPFNMAGSAYYGARSLANAYFGDYLDAALDATGAIAPAGSGILQSAKKLLPKEKTLITAENAANITPEQWTAAQDAAIARGDIAEAQRLRDLHFQVSAPNTVASVNGQPLQLYHGTNATFNTFDLSKYGSTDGGTFGRGVYTTPVKEYAELYGKNNMPLYMKLDNPRDYRNSSIGDLMAEKLAFGDDFATGNGIDGVIGRPSWKGFKGLEEYISHNPKNIKSSLPVTYGPDGTRIPLGIRDNFNINDIRYGLLAPLAGGTALFGYNSLGQPADTYKHGKDSGIHINPKNRGKFNALKKRTGKTTEQLTHSKNPLTRKRAIFAQNAKKFKH